MTEWKLKRFWTEASVSETEGGYAVLLDGRVVKTPAKTSLIVPRVELARAIAEEWDAQEGTIDPTTMPFTCSANAAIDKVTHQFDNHRIGSWTRNHQEYHLIFSSAMYTNSFSEQSHQFSTDHFDQYRILVQGRQ